MMRAITFVALTALIFFGCTNSKHIGVWIAERHGLMDSMIFHENGILTLYYNGKVMAGELVYYYRDSTMLKTTYTIDYSKTPAWLDVSYTDVVTGKITEKTKAIIEFLPDNKMMLRIPWDKNAERPAKFDYENKIGETMAYTKRK